MVHEAEAMVPAEVRYKSLRVVAYSEAESSAALEDAVYMLDEARNINAARSARCISRASATTIAVGCVQDPSLKETSSCDSSRKGTRSLSHPREDPISSPKSS